MGIQSDFVVADASEAAEIGASFEHARWPSHASTGLTHLEVALLHFALTGEDPNAPVKPPKVLRNPFTGKEQPMSVVIEYLKHRERRGGARTIAAQSPDAIRVAKKLCDAAPRLHLAGQARGPTI